MTDSILGGGNVRKPDSISPIGKNIASEIKRIGAEIDQLLTPGPEDNPNGYPEFDKEPYFTPELKTDLITEENIQALVVETAKAIEELRPDSVFSKIQDDLDLYKDKLGGSPHYAEGKPTLDLNRTFCGFPIDVVIGWITTAVEKKWIPEFFWNALIEAFDVKGGYTKYEYITLMLESLARLSANKEQITASILHGDSHAATIFVRDNTGLLIHIELTSPEFVCNTLINEILEMVPKYFEAAKKEGTLEKFFKEAFSTGSLCLDAKFTCFSKYVMEQKPNVDLAEGSAKVSEVPPDYTSSDPVRTIIDREFGLYAKKNDYEIYLNPFIDYLLNTRKVFSIEGMKEGRLQCITKEDLVDFISDQVNDELILVDDETIKEYVKEDDLDSIKLSVDRLIPN